MKIGIDCDGVLTNISEYIYEYGEKWFNRKPSNRQGYSVAEIFECSKKQEFYFGLKYFFRYCREWPPRKYAAEIIEMLNADGHQLYEITARNFTTMKNPLGWYSKHIFKTWFNHYGFKIDKVYFCSENHAPEDKLKGCYHFGIDVMIDDKPEVVQFLAQHGLTVLLFDAPYNQKVAGENIIRVMDWKDIHTKITSMATKL